jgi:hypothetical protein
LGVVVLTLSSTDSQARHSTALHIRSVKPSHLTNTQPRFIVSDYELGLDISEIRAE